MVQNLTKLENLFTPTIISWAEIVIQLEKDMKFYNIEHASKLISFYLYPKPSFLEITLCKENKNNKEELSWIFLNSSKHSNQCIIKIFDEDGNRSEILNELIYSYTQAYIIITDTIHNWINDYKLNVINEY